MAKKKRTRRPGTAGARKKAKRQAMPGGAPLARKRAKRSPARRAPKASASKPPCKYGPRLANGRCPAKPRGSRNRQTVTARSVEGASKQATDVILNPRASREQKVEAVAKVAEAAGTEAAKTAVRKVATPTRIARAKEAAKRFGPRVIELAKQTPIGGAVTAAQAVLKIDTYAKIRALEELAETEKALKRKLTPSERATLKKQYEEWFASHRETPIGKRGKR